jgi:molecular chaperone GrpE
MNQDHSGPDEEIDPAAPSAPPSGQAAPDEQNNPSLEAVVTSLNAELDALRAENQELKDRSLRLMAEMENLRRRTDRDKAEFSKYAISEFARDVLSVGDNIRRAIEAVPQDALVHDQALRVLVEGIEVTEKELIKALEKYQVKRFDPTGEPFNPHLHDAMTRVEMPNVPADTVVQVIQAGYMIAERVLRPASVIVAKEAQRAEKPDAASDESSDDADEPLPPGAMKIPDEVETPAEASAMAAAGVRTVRVDVQQSVLGGRDIQSERRRSGSGVPNEGAPIRRPRSPAGDQSFREVRTSNTSTGSKPSALHKPVINNKGD